MTSDVTIQTNRFQAEHKKYEKGGAIAWLLSLIVLLILIGVVVYAVYHRNWQAASDSGRREVNQAIASVKDASENAILTSKVKTALALSKHVSAFDINVDTNDGIVTLKGRVPSPETRRIAEEITRDTNGVRDVRNQLTVDISVKPGSQAARGGTHVSDSELRSRLESEYKMDQTLKHDTIKADVRDGIVTLEGNVRSAEEKQAAESRAWQLGAIKEVRNNLNVQVEGQQSRDQLSKRIEFELYSSGAFDLQKIKVHSNQGTVVLDGQVRSQAEKLLAEKIAQGVDGVKSIKDNLYVVPAPETQAAE